MAHGILTGTDIPVTARIIAVADSYDAMTSKRSYRAPIPQSKVREEIFKGMGTQFDPGLKEIYEKARPRLEDYYKSVNDNEKGKI